MSIRRWKWPLLAIIFTILMTYVLYWTGPLEYERSTFGILPIILSYGLLALGFFAIFAGILYELNTKFRVYYICESCNKNFVYEGKGNQDIRCPFCSSEKLHIATTITLKGFPRGIVWNPPKGKVEQSLEEKELKIPKYLDDAKRASYVVEVLDELCAHLQQIGIGAKVTWDDPSPEAVRYQISHGTFGGVESPLGCIRVEDSSIDVVRIHIESEMPWGYGKLDHWPFLPPGTSYRVTYNISYLVYGAVGNLEGDLKAETKPIRGLFEKKVTRLEWKGGRLAGILNADTYLMNTLSKMGSTSLAVKPHKEITSSSAGIRLVPRFNAEEASYDLQSHKEEQYVEIITSTIVADEMTARGQAFPTLKAFEAYERIAKHIRSIITYRPSS
jgi:DNA-directed RNA polymerase subunit RPC12/RpoP